MAPLPNPKNPSDVIMRDIAMSLRVLAGRDPDEGDGGTVPLREPVEGVDATPTVHTSKGSKPAEKPEPQTQPSGDDVNLDDMKRDQLDAYAAKVGVEDPTALPNKDAVKDAIRKATD